jgi:hypothetical protein
LAFHLGHEADHSPLSSAEVKEWVELYLHSPNTPPWRGAQLGGAQGQLYLSYLLPHYAVLSSFLLLSLSLAQIFTASCPHHFQSISFTYSETKFHMR